MGSNNAWTDPLRRSVKDNPALARRCDTCSFPIPRDCPNLWFRRDSRDGPDVEHAYLCDYCHAETKKACGAKQEALA